MSAFDQQFAAIAVPALNSAFGDPAIVTPKSGMPPVAGTPITTTARVSQQPQIVIGGDQGQETETLVHMYIPTADYPAPKRGDSVRITAGPNIGDYAMQTIVRCGGGEWTLACHIVSVTRPGAKGAQQVR